MRASSFIRRIGSVVHVSASGNIIVKAEGDVPRLGERIFNGDAKPIGIVVDVFGPVSSPYVSVRPEGARGTPKSKGLKVYVMASSQVKRKAKGRKSERGVSRD